ncbi:MAG: DUF885 domain-containing protein [Maricaulaceae bacterium]
MRKILLITSALFMVAACSPKSHDSTTIKADAVEQNLSVEEQMNVWLEDDFNAGVKHYPQFLAQLGIKERTDEWNDPTREFQLERLEENRLALAEFKSSFDRSELSENGQISYDLYIKNAEDEFARDKYHDYRYTFNQMRGAQSSIPTFMINFHKIKTAKDANDYITRLEKVNAQMGAIISNANKAADKGIMAPKFVYDHVIRDANNILSGAPFEDTKDLNVLMKDFRDKVEASDIADDQKEDLYERALTALLTSVKPAYQNVIRTANDHQDRTSDDDGAWKLPNGGEYYASRLEQMTTTNMTADEIHELGLKEVARIHTEMRAIMKDVEFEGTLQEFFTYLKEEPRFTYEDSDAGRQAYLDDATVMIDTMKGRLDEVFLRKPQADLVVKRVEAFRERSAGKAFYNRPAPDGSRPGVYYANLYKISDMPSYQMEALAYHEGIPGHHMQIAIAQELTGVPKFRKFGGYTAYSEGWGLYTEYFPKEMGFYSDPYSDFGRLSMEIWRAARLVVDTGLHHKKWTRQEAIDYLLENTPNPENDCVKAIERYIVMPGQATAYKIGMLKILEMRDKSRDALGDKFDIREFHDVFLAQGAVPLDVFERRVNDWIASKS